MSRKQTFISYLVAYLTIWAIFLVLMVILYLDILFDPRVWLAVKIVTFVFVSIGSFEVFRISKLLFILLERKD